MAQTIPEITYTDDVRSPLLVNRAISMKTAAAPKRRIAAVEYLFRCNRFVFRSSPISFHINIATEYYKRLDRFFKNIIISLLV